MAEETELRDSQLLDVARELDKEGKAKQTASLGIRQYVQSKQKIAQAEQKVSDLGKTISAKQQIIEDMNAEFATKKAAKEKELEDFITKLASEIERLKELIRSHEEAAILAEKKSQDAIKQATAEQRAKIAELNKAHQEQSAALSKARDEKEQRNHELDKQYTELQNAINVLRQKHGLT
jgi:chromosome segregation ATPase